LRNDVALILNEDEERLNGFRRERDIAPVAIEHFLGGAQPMRPKQENPTIWLCPSHSDFNVHRKGLTAYSDFCEEKGRIL
jgi:hypothetical protein